jgi:hypothetical protein
MSLCASKGSVSSSGCAEHTHVQGMWLHVLWPRPADLCVLAAAEAQVPEHLGGGAFGTVTQADWTNVTGVNIDSA